MSDSLSSRALAKVQELRKRWHPQTVPPLLELPLAVVEAVAPVLEHLQELRDAWERGALSSRDGKNGLRSNRNADVEVALRAALEAFCK